jgi:rSAM/selenodomain-associated transferase 2
MAEISARSARPRLSVVIPVVDHEPALAPCLEGVRAGAWGEDIETIVAAASEHTAAAQTAAAGGATVVAAEQGRGWQLGAGARASRGEWLLFVHADTVLGAGWAEEAGAFMDEPRNAERAGAFRLALDDPAAAARRLEAMVAWRCRVFGLPYGDQGLLISRAFYDRLGGFAHVPLMEDVAFVRRIGRGRLQFFETAALTSAARYRRAGYVWRSARNLGCLALYLLGVPPRLIARLYG